MTFHKVVLAGATGNVGARVLFHLLTSTDHTFGVTVLARSAEQTAESFVAAAGLPKSSSHEFKVVNVDYGNQESIVKAIKGADVVVTALSNTPAQVDSQILAAAKTAGVRRFIPSQYTLDVLSPVAVERFTEDWPDAFPVAVARQYEALGQEDGPTSATIILTSMFLDTFLTLGLFNFFNIKDRKTTAVDGGDSSFTACTVDFIGASIVAVLKMPEESTKNKRIPIAELRATTNELIKTIEEVFQIKIDVDHKTGEEMVMKRKAALEAGNYMAAYANTVVRMAGDGSGPADLEVGLKFDGDGTFKYSRKTLRDVVLAVKSTM